MPHNPIRVVVNLASYSSHLGSFDYPHDFSTDEQLSRAVWIYDKHATVAAQTKLPPAFGLPGVKHILSHGHCSKSDMQQLMVESDDDYSVVIGVGNNALPDTTKALARRLGLSFVAAPTITATCAVRTPFSAWYSDAGQALHYEIFDDANFMVLMKPEIVLNTPQQCLLTGIGGTLVKWYEAVVLIPQPEALPLTVRLGINNTQATRDVLLNSNEQALVDQQNQQLTQSFCSMVDVIIAGGGMVGGLGDHLTCVATAHIVHNGLTVLLQAERFLHDIKVAYGVLVQDALLGQDDVLAQLTGTYQRFHLPATLAELEMDINNQAEIDKVTAYTLRPVESTCYLPVTLTPNTLRAAFKKVGSFKA